MAMMDKAKWNELLTRAVNEPGVIHSAYSAFHTYSTGNQLAALFQCMERGIQPGPLRTYKAWQAAGRQVRRGEKALWLCMPMVVKDKVRVDQNGDPKRATIFTWKPYWFVMSQTDGETMPVAALPEWNEENALAGLNITRVEFAHTNGNVAGYAKDRTVAVSPIAPLPYKTLFHELAHVVLGHTDHEDHDANLPRSLREVEAESVAMLVLESLGLDGAEYCRGYIQNWLESESIPDASAGRIFSAADKILKAGTVTVSAETAVAA